MSAPSTRGWGDPAGPLAGVRVVALEQAVAGPLCTRHLADLGARVTKVERPGGDFARHYDSVVLGMSAYFVWLNHGKRSVALDLSLPADRDAFDALLDDADVLVHNLGPGAVDRLGYAWQQAHARWPSLIVCAISGFGSDGSFRARKAFDLLLQGESGLLSVTGPPAEPARVGVSIADISAGMYALSSLLACLYERREGGEGRFIDISMLDCLAEWMTVPAYYQLYAGAAPPRTGLHHNTIAPYGPYATGDGGTVIVAVQNDGQWRRFCSGVLGAPELARDLRFETNPARVAHRDELDTIINGVLGAQVKEHVERALEGADVPFGSLNSVRDLVEHPQLAARQRWTEADSPAGPVRTLVPPFNIAGFRPRPGAVPELPE
jgi:crotonobetainyl-CoA:carnitine CoA-transferase CaiB-like acyl-CoA transferase